MKLVSLILVLACFGLAGCKITAPSPGPPSGDPRPDAQTQDQPMEMEMSGYKPDATGGELDADLRRHPDQSGGRKRRARPDHLAQRVHGRSGPDG